jgi:hypothetical protein
MQGVKPWRGRLTLLASDHGAEPVALTGAIGTSWLAAWLVGDGQQLGGKRVQVDLVPQTDAERLDGHGGVVLAALKRRSTTCWMRRRAGWNKAATARVAPATAQLGGWSLTPPNSWPRTKTAPA